MDGIFGDSALYVLAASTWHNFRTACIIIQRRTDSGRWRDESFEKEKDEKRTENVKKRGKDICKFIARFVCRGWTGQIQRVEKESKKADANVKLLRTNRCESVSEWVKFLWSSLICSSHDCTHEMYSLRSFLERHYKSPHMRKLEQ